MTTEFEGTLRECVLHHKENHTTTKEDAVTVAELADVSTRTARKWLSGGKSIGLHRLALTIYLEKFGYFVYEISQTSAPVRKLGSLLLEGKVDGKVVQERLGYSRYQGVIDIVLGRHEPSTDKLSRIRDIVAQFETSRKPIDEKGYENRKPRISEQLQKGNSQGKDIGLSLFAKREFETEFVGHANALLALSEIFLSDSFSADERNQLRKKVQGGKGIFNLSNRLNELCSETARRKS